jgi:hypothetical protein
VHFGTWYFSPINRHFHHWDPEVLAEVYNLNIKTPPARAKKKKMISCIFMPKK